MENINYILELLHKRKSTNHYEYNIPKTFDYGRYTDIFSVNDTKVNPYDYLIHYIKNHIINNKQAQTLSTDLSNAIIYSIFPRCLSSWHYTDNKLQTGTLLKCMCYLPRLKDFGVNILYVLPIFEYSRAYKKGMLGSPYAIKNIYKIDQSLHDPLLGDYNEEILDIELKAFIEAAHHLGIKVIFDFPVRSVARDNVLISEHPEWFYWVKLQYSECFPVPKLRSISEPIWIDENNVHLLYDEVDLESYIDMFSLPPNVLDESKWSYLKDKFSNSENFIEIIEKEFNITTLPGFSDGVNDLQPLWSDITFYRLYMDSHEYCQKRLPGCDIPFLMQDGIKQNILHGNKVNTELWDYICNIIPHYYKKYKIDGARIDMGHALPDELNEKIIESVKMISDDFLFWSEDFEVSSSYIAKRNGYDFMTGNLWNDILKYKEPGEFKRIIVDLSECSIPVVGALEIPDTPRIAYIIKDIQQLKHLTILNYILPNSIPLINCGQELGEVQPMNLGLNNTELGRFVLNQDDAMYGRLAFFDEYELHWNLDNTYYQEILEEAYKIREQIRNITFFRENILSESFNTLINLNFYSKAENVGIAFFLNIGNNEVQVDLEEIYTSVFDISNFNIEAIFRSNDHINKLKPIEQCISIESNEMLILRCTCDH